MTTLGGPSVSKAPPQKTRKKNSRGSKAPKRIEIDGQQFTIIRKLGKGAYGTVEKVEDEEGYSYAIKRVEYRPSRGVYADIIKEMDILRRFAGHPNVIGLCGYVWRETEFIVLLEYGGTPLHRYIGDVEYGERMDLLPMILVQLLSALGYLHSCGICHRDIKPDNVLVQEFEESDGVLIPYLRLCDFGLSKNMALKRNTPKTSTLWYRAPENLQKLERYGFNIDIWAVGCLLYEYVTGDVLFEADSSAACMLQIIHTLGPISDITYSRLNIDKAKIPKRHPRRNVMKPIDDGDVRRLMMRMLTVDPVSRPTAQEMLQDEYFARHADGISRLNVFIADERRHREREQHEQMLRTHSNPPAENPAYTPQIRQALVQWLLEIQQADREETHPQTVFLGIELFDEVMTKWGPLQNDSDLKYIALTCLGIASKYLELGLDLDFIYCWNNQKFHENQGVPRNKIKEPSDKEVNDYIANLISYEQRCLLLLDFRIGGRVTTLDRQKGNYKKAKRDALAQSTYVVPEPPQDISYSEHELTDDEDDTHST